MTHDAKSLARLAAAIHQQLHSQESMANLSPLPTAAWRQSERLWHRLHRSRQRGWQLAANRLQHDLTVSIQRLQSELAEHVSQSLLPRNESLMASVDLMTLFRNPSTLRLRPAERAIGRGDL